MPNFLWNYTPLFIGIIYIIVIIAYTFIIKKNFNILNFLALIMITISFVFLTLGDQSAYINISDYFNNQLYSTTILLISILFFLFFIITVIGNSFVIFNKKINLFYKKIIVSISSFLLTFQFFFIKLLEPDYLWLLEEVDKSDYYIKTKETLLNCASQSIILLLIGILISVIITDYLFVFYKQKKKKKKKR